MNKIAKSLLTLSLSALLASCGCSQEAPTSSSQGQVSSQPTGLSTPPTQTSEPAATSTAPAQTSTQPTGLSTPPAASNSEEPPVVSSSEPAVVSSDPGQQSSESSQQSQSSAEEPEGIHNVFLVHASSAVTPCSKNEQATGIEYQLLGIEFETDVAFSFSYKDGTEEKWVHADALENDSLGADSGNQNHDIALVAGKYDMFIKFGESAVSVFIRVYDDGSPVQGENVAISVTAPSDWEAVYVYAWTGAKENAKWPGVALTETSAGSHVWTGEVNNGYEHLIFNNGKNEDEGQKKSDAIGWDGIQTDFDLTQEQTAFSQKISYGTPGEEEWFNTIMTSITPPEGWTKQYEAEIDLEEGQAFGFKLEDDSWISYDKLETDCKDLFEKSGNDAVVKEAGTYHFYLKLKDGDQAIYALKVADIDFDLEEFVGKLNTTALTFVEDTTSTDPNVAKQFKATTDVTKDDVLSFTYSDLPLTSVTASGAGNNAKVTEGVMSVLTTKEDAELYFKVKTDGSLDVWLTGYEAPADPGDPDPETFKQQIAHGAHGAESWAKVDMEKSASAPSGWTEQYEAEIDLAKDEAFGFFLEDSSFISYGKLETGCQALFNNNSGDAEAKEAGTYHFYLKLKDGDQAIYAIKVVNVDFDLDKFVGKLDTTELTFVEDTTSTDPNVAKQYKAAEIDVTKDAVLSFTYENEALTTVTASGDTNNAAKSEGVISVRQSAEDVNLYFKIKTDGSYDIWLEGYVEPTPTGLTGTKNGDALTLTDLKSYTSGTDKAVYVLDLAKDDVVAFQNDGEALQFGNDSSAKTYTAAASGSYIFYINSSYQVWPGSIETQFSVTKDTGSGKSIYVAGSWDSWAGKTKLTWHEGNVWSGEVADLEAGIYQFKYVIADTSEFANADWDTLNGSNRTIYIAAAAE